MAGRYTPKKTGAQRAADAAVKQAESSMRAKTGGANPDRASAATRSSGRYTPPAPPPEAMKPTPVWVLPAMFISFILGVLAIILNYLEVLPGSPTNAYLLGGLVFVVLGFLAATQLR